MAHKSFAAEIFFARFPISTTISTAIQPTKQPTNLHTSFFFFEYPHPRDYFFIRPALPCGCFLMAKVSTCDGSGLRPPFFGGSWGLSRTICREQLKHDVEICGLWTRAYIGLTLCSRRSRLSNSNALGSSSSRTTNCCCHKATGNQPATGWIRCNFVTWKETNELADRYAHRKDTTGKYISNCNDFECDGWLNGL